MKKERGKDKGRKKRERDLTKRRNEHTVGERKETCGNVLYTREQQALK